MTYSTLSTASTDIGPILVANRGEIARRIIHSAKSRGLATVAVHSDADAEAPFVTEADAAVRLPGVTPAETYLDVEKIMDAAQRSGARSIHPGYGFLSENAEFATAVIDAGLTWIGPPPEAIVAMGSKTRAKEMMANADVPVLTNLARDEITEDMLPVLIKASAGGGGRGMRVVDDLDAIDSEWDRAAAEAQSAFGDGTVFCERYIASGRHIEVQLMADTQGTVWAVGERECSIQRRHQKVIEEAPSPLVERIDGMRTRLFEAAENAAQAVGYTGAGTVEFLANNDGEFFFLEMNTRLQVEHPVTEATTGLDLVALQFDIAAGLPLPADKPPAIVGWSLEARLYAEDPGNDWQPMSGELTAMEFDQVVSQFTGPASTGIRIDSGFTPEPHTPTVVGTNYDAMLAKVISWAPTRRDAVGRLAATLRRGRIHGLGTNRDLLVRILDDPDFRDGDFDTSFLSGARLEELSVPLADATTVNLCLFAAAVALEDKTSETLPTPPVPAGYRNVGTATTTHRFTLAGEEVTTDINRSRLGVARGTGANDGAIVEAVTRSRTCAHATTVRISANSVTRPFVVYAYPNGSVTVDSPLGSINLETMPRYDDPSLAAAEGSLMSPMPGSIIAIHAEVGATVEAGQLLLSMEAMKMEHGIRADTDGVVTELPVKVGDQVDAGKVLAIVSDPEE
ncbi:biotin/lipoyl-binding protein [Corynebacterium sp. TAE3-ERU12]|uniref:acetyl/propionyl/methylcrotonyl-CoA carboxylase subunit alpha n=1 Tax=Corynebacterium sp. TAE3-ERU12 TaxID=2849491 RepID=UPI001C479895|nr:biotin carboxylase N-terminal domain-containing protein [Corynebacterium sp. TAE3-ERU12]MBV7294788.1 biotin/lipoyl-binding protein [Corynebacterium sp. TAE3-ERU12]